MPKGTAGTTASTRGKNMTVTPAGVQLTTMRTRRSHHLRHRHNVDKVAGSTLVVVVVAAVVVVVVAAAATRTVT